MLLSPIGRWIPGWIRVEAEGGFPEKLLNGLTRQKIAVWKITRRQETVRFCCHPRDYRRIRPLAEHACVRMRVRRKCGLPFWIRRYRRRRGLLAAVAVYAAVLAVLSPRIWVVQVIGNGEEDPAPILTAAAEKGVKLGAKTDKIDIKGLEIDGLSRLPSLSWITVNPRGCVARIEVTRRMPTPEILDLSVPSDMVAVRDGKIVSMDVFGGQASVKIGEAVKAGTVLISGTVETEQGKRLYRSYGEVIAETRRQITVSVPLVYTRTIPDGRVWTRSAWQFLCWRIPLSASVDLPEGCAVVRRSHIWTVDGRQMPFGVIHEYYLPVTAVKVARTRQQALELATARLREEEAALFLPDSYTLLETRESVVSGNLRLTAVYRCLENIAHEIPLTTAPDEAKSTGGEWVKFVYFDG